MVGQTRKRVRLQVSDCDSHVKRAVTRSDGRVRSVCSFPFVTLSARSFVIARFAARSALDFWFELLLRQAVETSVSQQHS